MPARVCSAHFPGMRRHFDALLTLHGRAPGGVVQSWIRNQQNSRAVRRLSSLSERRFRAHFVPPPSFVCAHTGTHGNEGEWKRAEGILSVPGQLHFVPPGYSANIQLIRLLGHLFGTGPKGRNAGPASSEVPFTSMIDCRWRGGNSNFTTTFGFRTSSTPRLTLWFVLHFHGIGFRVLFKFLRAWWRGQFFPYLGCMFVNATTIENYIFERKWQLLIGM